VGVENMSSHKFYPAFATNGDPFAPDSVNGLVDPGVIRIYTPADAWLSSPAVNIYSGTETATAIFDPYEGEYIVCNDFEQFSGQTIFVYSQVDGEYKCNYSANEAATKSLRAVNRALKEALN